MISILVRAIKGSLGFRGIFLQRLLLRVFLYFYVQTVEISG